MPFGARPAVVDAVAATGRRGRPVDLLPGAQPDVADHEVAGRAVEREPPRVAQPGRPHPGAGQVPGSGGAGPRVDPQDLAEQRVRVLRVVGIAPAVARAHVQEAVRPEVELAAVVVLRVAVVDSEDRTQRGGVGAVRVRRALALEHLQITQRLLQGQEHVEAPARREVGREGDREQPALRVAALRARGDVQERAAADDLHDAGALDHEHSRVVRRGGDVHRTREVAERYERRRRGGGSGGSEQHGDGQQRGAHQWSATWPSAGSSGSPPSSHAVIPPSIEYAS